MEHNMLPELSRRRFITLVAALKCTVGGFKLDAENRCEQFGSAPLRALNLPEDELRELETLAAPVLEAARTLDELDLGGMPIGVLEPDFVFTAEQKVDEDESGKAG
jgi:hypothetical protein